MMEPNELNKWLAINVLGWKEVKGEWVLFGDVIRLDNNGDTFCISPELYASIAKRYDGKNYICIPYEEPRNYCTDIKDAWLLINQTIEGGWSICIEKVLDMQWKCIFAREIEGVLYHQEFSANADTPAMAIALACHKAYKNK